MIGAHGADDALGVGEVLHIEGAQLEAEVGEVILGAAEDLRVEALTVAHELLEVHLADDLAPCAEDDLRAAGRQPVNDAQCQTDCTAHNSNFSREIKHLTNGRQTLKRTCGHLKHHFLIHQIILFLCIFA